MLRRRAAFGRYFSLGNCCRHCVVNIQAIVEAVKGLLYQELRVAVEGPSSFRTKINLDHCDSAQHKLD